MNDMLRMWVEKIRENNAKQVAELYHDNGLLLGTFSNIERQGKKLILDYFEDLLKSKIDVEIITEHEFEANSLIVISGFYNFKIVNDTIKARYSFVFLKIKDSWKILSHHSSVLPNNI